MFYLSTRNSSVKKSAAQAIIEGLSADGGLFVPSEFPAVSMEQITAFADMPYAEAAAYVFSLFLSDFDKDEILAATVASQSKFEEGEPAPVVKVKDGVFVLELWHGPTYAFKDLALTVLPHLMVASKRKVGATAETVILVATSGDTGKAALEGFKDVEGTRIIVLYPTDGVSPQQKLQMQIQEGGNVACIGIEGNFDDAQRTVKEIFSSAELIGKFAAAGKALSSANSINFGRLLPQVVYYFTAYADMVAACEINAGDKVNFVVPCGNFGNVLAGYYARRMGLPVGKLICASNSNNVLSDFIATGRYDRKREFYKTISPSMDILVSSNVERLIFELSGRDSKITAERLKSLSESGGYELTEAETAELREIFYSGYADDEETKAMIEEVFEEEGYLADPHTAVALKVLEQFVSEGINDYNTVVLSTANPYKFSTAVLEALGETASKDENKAVNQLYNISAMEIPEGIRTAHSKPVIHTRTVDKSGITAAVTELVLADGSRGLSRRQ